MARGSGRKRRLALLEQVATDDPERAERLVELRRAKPQAYRKALRAIGRKRGLTIYIGGRAVIPPPHPGRETDSAFDVNARTGEAPLEGAPEKKRATKKKADAG